MFTYRPGAVERSPKDSPTPLFVSEPITPDPRTFDASSAARGLAALPAAFTWRGRRYCIAKLIERNKVSRPEMHTRGESYLTRETFRVRLDDGRTATLYFERQTRRGASGRAARRRWYLYTIESSDHTAAEGPQQGQPYTLDPA